MAWQELLVGAMLGAVVGLIVQNIIFPYMTIRWKTKRSQAYHRASNAAWEHVEERVSPRLQLAQSGWTPNGYFAEGTVTLRLNDAPFHFSDGRLVELRERHSPTWERLNLTDGEQVGISEIHLLRTSDDGRDELTGRDHQLRLVTHRYRYFDYLATHRLMLEGTPDERSLLESIAKDAGPLTATNGFPNPCSVGVSLLCESGNVLVLTRRAKSPSLGGHWYGGKIFNAVGENVAVRDFTTDLDGMLVATPETVAKRGLNEEMGFSIGDISACVIQIHSFAWADIYDHKFFGLAISPLSYAEVRRRWLNAPDREGDPEPWPAATRSDCKALLSSINRQPEEWAPEAVFATVRSLLAVRMITPKDLTDIFR